jgi:hypothetical protein
MMVGQIKKNHTMPRATETWTSDVDISPVKNLLTRHVLSQPAKVATQQKFETNIIHHLFKVVGSSLESQIYR